MTPSLNGTVTCLVSGSWLFWHELTSPLELGVLVLLIASIPITYFLAKRFPWLRKYSQRTMIIVVALLTVMGVITIVVVTYIGVRPSLSYGAWLSGSTLHVRFYEDKVVDVDICNSSMSLTSTKKALDMLSIRTNGVSDPTSGTHMGYYRTHDGRKAYVIILAHSSNKAIIINTGKAYVIIALPCTQRLYNELAAARTELCTGG